jgi:4-amino-4-deoxy-L-arabinose transferase-like glycosyltransferase
VSSPTRDDLALADDAASPAQRDPARHGDEIDRAVRVALIAAGVATFLMCGAVAIAMVPLGTRDETAHLDYAYQVWHGRLPVFEHGLLFHPTSPALIPPVQWESQHPPLNYALVAPIVGPLIDAGHWIVATMAARLINCVISALSVVAIAWAAGSAVGRDRARWTILSGAAATTIGAIIFVGGTAYSDPLLTLLSVLAAGLALRAVHRGLSARSLALACVVAALGAVARAEFAIALVVLATGLAIAAWLHSDGSTSKRLERALVAGVLPIVAAGAASGWFYLRNKRLTGNYAGTQLKWGSEHLGRVPRSISDVLHYDAFWNTQFSVLRHPLDGRYLLHHARYVIDTDVMQTLFKVLLILGALVALRALWGAIRHRDRARLAAMALLAMLGVVTFAYEVVYISGGGGSISRYLVPAVVPICMIIAAGLQAVPRRFQPAALAAYLSICYSMFAFWLIVTPHTGGVFGTGPSRAPWIVALGTLPLIAVCAALQVRALSKVRT